jgi:glyoxylase I family protein
MLGALHHLALTVSDRTKSELFYDAVLNFMGYEQIEKTEAFTMWWLPQAGAILLYAANPNSPNPQHDRYSPGFHHLAFNADRREQVDELYQRLVEMNAQILDPPAEYPNYAPGYYAVFFADPDGLKLELVHMPNL